jgi:hypothetical protein
MRDAVARGRHGEGCLAQRLDVEEVEAEGRVVVVTATPVEGRVQIVLQLLLNFGLPAGP